MTTCANCKKPIGDWRMSTMCRCLSHDLRKRIAELEKIAERYNRLKNMAVKKTAYDRYGDGCHWSIGFFSDDSTMSFDDAVDRWGGGE